MKDDYFLSIDQGTSSSRVVLYDSKLNLIDQVSCELQIITPQDQYVEQDPNEIFNSVVYCLESIIEKNKNINILAAGITNQRETFVVWDKKTGKVLHNAVVWQCRRSVDICEKIKNEGLEKQIKEITGLSTDPYFTATKLRYLITNNKKVKEAYFTKNLMFGTIDTWLIYKFTNQYLIEVTNASRTMLMDIKNLSWSQEMLDILDLNNLHLPKIVDSDFDFGEILINNLKIPITAVLGDQMSSLVGNSCFEKNSCKCTFGTGAFLLKNTGVDLETTNDLLSTISYVKKGRVNYALEGSVFIAGSLFKWIKKIGLITGYTDIDLAASSSKSENVVIVPAFSGLGAPYWDSSAAGMIIGLNLSTTKEDMILACLKAVAFSVNDLLKDECLKTVKNISIDGGLIKSDYFVNLLAGITKKNISLSQVSERTALGVAIFCASKHFNIELEDVELGKNYAFFSAKPLNIDQKQYNLWDKAICKSQNWY